ncbi:MAG: UDP-N-acetylmuramoyl-tripeptide--D-alanyl-D-alanine ligase [Flavobacteriales bacterium]|nr:UDP-N-acetylmuramoyl-tripeptide--D-alanyl-D-alanine ligase [Flavobacteriales bacterium]|tara:strand:- start:11693 stop:12949 length:1257 start_codon:yes stop_codon:yes gene_type:complete
MNIALIYKLFLDNSTVFTDSRKINGKGIFFALRGEKFNGNEFAKNALRDGATYCIVDDEKIANNRNIIYVKNTLTTLQELATYHRNKLSIPIIGITGSNGKTTSKELIYQILKSEICCYATKGNLNNHIGVPLSILEINSNHEIAIIEMGANHLKEISFLCKISKPTYGIITNIGSAHLEGFKNLAGVIKTKNELYEYVEKNNGTLFVNNEDTLLMKLSQKIQRITYGKNGLTKGKLIENEKELKIQFKNQIIKSQLIGDYQFYNIMLAISIGEFFNINLENTKKAIKNYLPTNNRSEIIKTKQNTLILDAYNANPSSMKAMINSFSKKKYKNKLCILGDMLELGTHSFNEHHKILKLINKLNIKAIFVGKEFLNVNQNAFENRSSLEDFLKNNPIRNHTILLKGSRSISLEKLTKYL